MDPIFDKYGVSYINFSISSIHINMFLDGGVSSFSINQNQGPNESMYFVCFFFLSRRRKWHSMPCMQYQYQSFFFPSFDFQIRLPALPRKASINLLYITQPFHHLELNTLNQKLAQKPLQQSSKMARPSSFSSYMAIFTLAFLVIFTSHSSAQLSTNFYSKSCPKVFGAVKSVVQSAVSKERRMGASLVRLFFHDCFVRVFLFFSLLN